MALWERWYMNNPARQREAWRRHRPPERIAPPFKVVVRRPSTIRIRLWMQRFGWLGWLMLGAALGGAVMLSLLWQEGARTELADAVMWQIASLLALGEEGLARLRAAWCD